jgi:uncharacterized protein YndB with AHSA1/START domain
MRRYIHETVVSTPPESLFRAITDINHWPRWDPELESIEHDGALAPGTRFFLTPRGGPRVRMSIEKAEAPSCFSDLSHLPLATLRTVHEFLPAPGGGTRVRLTLEVFGPLGFLWDRLVVRKQAAGAEAQTRAFVRHVEERS